MYVPTMLEEEEVIKRKILKILTPTKPLIRRPVLLVQITMEMIHTNNKSKLDKYYIFCITTVKSPNNFITI